MGLFSRKKKEDFDLPPLPKLPGLDSGLPRAPEPPRAHRLAKPMPDMPNFGKLPEFEAKHEALPELQPLPSAGGPEFPELPSELQPSVGITRPRAPMARQGPRAAPTQQIGTTDRTPVFIRIDKYKKALDTIRQMQGKLD